MALAKEKNDRQSDDISLLIDHSLKVAIGEWHDVSEILREFKDMEPLEQMEFLSEWNKATDRFSIINDYYDGGEMNRRQISDYYILVKLISEYKEAIDNLEMEAGLIYRFKIAK